MHKVLLLAGGRGTRLSEHTGTTPKPLVEAKGRPLLWHIMQNYSRFDFNEFVILAGYRSFQIKEYFANYWLHDADIEIDLSNSSTTLLSKNERDWKIKILDTGIEAQTGSRVLSARKYVEEVFFLTYGDGVGSVNIKELLDSHSRNNKMVTVTAVRPPSRFGALTIEDGSIVGFQEKPSGNSDWINGGFFVCNREVFDLLWEQDCSFEYDVLPKLAKEGHLNVYFHEGSWQPVDNIRDLERLEEGLSQGDYPWFRKE
jgi:glucose-1-phosphate cytidylyltransferase